MLFHLLVYLLTEESYVLTHTCKNTCTHRRLLLVLQQPAHCNQRSQDTGSLHPNREPLHAAFQPHPSLPQSHRPSFLKHCINGITQYVTFWELFTYIQTLGIFPVLSCFLELERWLWLRALAALTKDLSSVPGTHAVTDRQQPLSQAHVIRCPPLASMAHCRCTHNKQNTEIVTSKSFKANVLCPELLLSLIY